MNSAKYSILSIPTGLNASFNSRNKDYRFAFNGQEKDDEVSGSGNTMTAEFWEYNARLGRRFNIDPKPNPALSSYACFANNPIWFCDPYGDTVKYNSFADRIIVGMARVLNRDFNKDFKTLKSSQETYVFKKGDQSSNQEGVFSTDGDKLFINYQFSKPSAYTGVGRFGSLFHETKHGVQFEYGELGFKYNAINKNWEPSGGYDIEDEVDAYNAQYKNGKPAYYDINTGRMQQTNAAYYNSQTSEGKVQALYLMTDSGNDKPDSPYRNLPTVRVNNKNVIKIKNNENYKLPHRIR